MRYNKLMTKKQVALVVFVIAVIALGAYAFRVPKSAETPKQKQATKQQEKAKTPPPPPYVNLQPTIDTWTTSQSADFGISVYDIANNKASGEHQADKQFLIASVVKLYIAYITLQDFQTGNQNPDDPAIGGYTKKECVHRMIQSSDNPCGDRMYDIVTPREATTRLQAFGLTNTQVSTYKSTANDINKLLLRLHNKKDLNQENTDYLLNAMHTQTYRNGLPAGMPDAEVADKVGFYGNHLWHDVGIVTLPNKRVYLVSIFGYNGSNSVKIANFGETIYPLINNN